MLRFCISLKVSHNEHRLMYLLVIGMSYLEKFQFKSLVYLLFVVLFLFESYELLNIFLIFARYLFGL